MSSVRRLSELNDRISFSLSILALDKVNLLIFDECHHSKGEACYAALMNRHYDQCHDQPRILGLTASISAKKIKPHQLSNEARQIEITYR
jgi:endoribonuclease Dicer